jgi:hypothetical protein
MATFSQILTRMRTRISNDDKGNQRRHARRRMDQCVGIVNGKTFPVEDWSVGGVLLTGDDRMFGVDQKADITLKFALSDRIMAVAHQGKIVRKTKDRFAIEFSPLSRDISHDFQTVIDDYDRRYTTA